MPSDAPGSLDLAGKKTPGGSLLQHPLRDPLIPGGIGMDICQEYCPAQPILWSYMAFYNGSAAAHKNHGNRLEVKTGLHNGGQDPLRIDPSMV